jgi:hypothetical protein
MSTPPKPQSRLRSRPLLLHSELFWLLVGAGAAMSAATALLWLFSRT